MTVAFVQGVVWLKESVIRESLDRNIEADLDRALDVIVPRSGPRALAESVSRLDREVAIFAICRISPSLPDLKINYLYAPGLT
jgi:hypothetical protein